MEIYFLTKKLQKLCSSKQEMKKRKLGNKLASKLKQRLAELESSEFLEDMKYIKAARCHELKGDRKGEFSVDLEHPFRLIFKPYNDPIPYKNDGGLDWSRIDSIVIIEVVDYH